MILSLQTNPFNNINITEDVTFWHIPNQILFLVTTFILIFIVFEEDIKRLTLENKKLNTQIEKSKVFVNLGENIAGLVHNLNGDIGLISMSISLLEDEIEHPAIKYVKNGNTRLQDKVANILTLARYSQMEESIEFSINALLHSLIEVFTIDKGFKRIKLEKDFQNVVIFLGNPSEISQVFENIIKNAYEALIEKWKNSIDRKIVDYIPMLTISIKEENDYSKIIFTDNGPGISVCIDRDCEGQCSNCEAFKVGRTTKDRGSGLGMISVLRTLQKYNGDLKIETSVEGSSISVILPG